MNHDDRWVLVLPAARRRRPAAQAASEATKITITNQQIKSK
jgi:hypothetical protein